MYSPLVGGTVLWLLCTSTGVVIAAEVEGAGLVPDLGVPSRTGWGPWSTTVASALAVFSTDYYPEVWPSLSFSVSIRSLMTVDSFRVEAPFGLHPPWK